MTKRTKTKRAKALDAGSTPELSRRPAAKALPNGSLSHSGHGIAELAQDLADLQALCTMMSNAEGSAERAREKQAAENIHAEEHVRCCHAASDIEDIQRRSHEMVDALERLLLTLEPTTLSETLSLALLLAQELDVFLGTPTNHTSYAVGVEKQRLGVGKQRLDDALQAIIRGLVHGAGASSPLLDAYSNRSTLVQWNAARSTAAREASRYLLGNGDAGEVRS